MAQSNSPNRIFLLTLEFPRRFNHIHINFVVNVRVVLGLAEYQTGNVDVLIKKILQNLTYL